MCFEGSNVSKVCGSHCLGYGTGGPLLGDMSDGGGCALGGNFLGEAGGLPRDDDSGNPCGSSA